MAFEIARRHRFQSDMANLPDGVQVHVLPTGGTAAPAFNEVTRQLRARVPTGVGQQIDNAHRATAAYLRDAA